jgi:integrase/recombinase XerD
MLIAHVERYLSLRQMLGYKLRNTSGNLRAFARFAAGRGDTHVRISTAMDWATEGASPHTRHIRLRDTAQLARFLHAEDPIRFARPSGGLCPTFTRRRRLCSLSKRPVVFASRTHFDDKFTQRCSG